MQCTSHGNPQLNDAKMHAQFSAAQPTQPIKTQRCMPNSAQHNPITQPTQTTNTEDPIPDEERKEVDQTKDRGSRTQNRDEWSEIGRAPVFQRRPVPTPRNVSDNATPHITPHHNHHNKSQPPLHNTSHHVTPHHTTPPRQVTPHHTTLDNGRSLRRRPFLS